MLSSVQDQSVIRSLILEVVGVYIIEELSSCYENSVLKNLAMIIHQNHLEILDAIIKGNYCRYTDKITKLVNLIVQNKKLNKSNMLFKNSCLIKKILKDLMDLSTHSASIEYILVNIKKIPMSTAKSLLQGKMRIQYLPPKSNVAYYTLVLDLDETLVHYREDSSDPCLLIRPFCSEFLRQTSGCFELVVFTASVQRNW